MSLVDLTPREFQLSTQRRRRLRLWSVIILVVALVAAGVSGIKYVSYLRLNQASKGTDQQFDGVRRDIELLAQKKNQLEPWHDRIVVLNVLSQYHDFAPLIDFLAQETPNLIYLQEMKLARRESSDTEPSEPETKLPKSAEMFILKKSDETPPSVIPKRETLWLSLKGRALQHEIVADYLRLFEGSSTFSAIDFKRSVRLNKNSNEIIEFELQCALRPPCITSGIDYAYLLQTENF